MGFDDGNGSELTSSADFSYKFAKLMHDHNFKLERLAAAAGVDYSTAHEAIMRGADGLPATSVTLQRMLSVFGIGLEYLLCPGTGGRRSYADEAETVALEAWKFCRRYRIPKHHCIPYVEYVKSLLQSKPLSNTTTLKLAARPPRLPHGMLEHIELYEQLVRSGVLGS